MNLHEQFADDLSLYALGALTSEERRAVEEHLEECSACRREVEQLRGDWALLAVSASGPRPPARSRERLMAAIASEPRHAEAHPHKRRAWWTVLEWAAALAALVLFGLLVHQNSELRGRIADLDANSAKQE
jgi:anti-sigma factor RsiW